MEIRNAEKKDICRIIELLEQVREVHHKVRPDLFKGNGGKYDSIELESLIRDSRRPIFVAVDEDDRVVGYAMCMIIIHEDENVLNDLKTLYIDDLCVDEEYRGRHVGSALYDHTLSYARENGFYNVTLNAWNGNDKAIDFYEKRCKMKIQKYGMETIL